MRLAAVRPHDDQFGPTIIVECGDFEVASGRNVDVEHSGMTITCVVVVTPEQILGSPPRATGKITAVHPLNQSTDHALALSALDSHPATTLPVIGQTVTTRQGAGEVTRIDVPPDEC